MRAARGRRGCDQLELRRPLEQPDVPIPERIGLPSERVHLLGKNIVLAGILIGELLAEPLQGPWLGLQPLRYS